MATTRFKDSVLFREDTADSGVNNASLYAGLPVGIEALGWHIFDPFLAVNDDTFPAAAEEPGASWTVTVTGTTPVASASDDLFPPRIIITNSAGDNDSWEGQYTAASGAGEFFNLTAAKRRYVEAQFLLTDANDDASTVLQNDVFIGMAITDTTVIDGATDFIGFHKADGSGIINFVAGKNAGTSGALVDDIVQSTGITLAAANAGTATANLTRLGFLTIGTDQVLVYANGAHVASVRSTTELPDDEQLAPTICLQNGEAVAKIMHVARYFCAMEI